MIDRAAARAIVSARQREETQALLARHARERSRMEFAHMRLIERHRRQFVLLGRQHIADWDLLASAAGCVRGNA